MLSVTQILTLSGRIDARWFTPEARERGSLVHRLTEQIDRHEAVVIPPHVQGYVEAYYDFLAMVQPVWRLSEWPVVDASGGLAGCLDRTFTRLFNREASGILDFKTGDEAAWHGLQLAAYDRLVPTGERYGLYLRKNGRWRLKVYDNPRDRRQFDYDHAQLRGTVHADGDFWRENP